MITLPNTGAETGDALCTVYLIYSWMNTLCTKNANMWN